MKFPRIVSLLILACLMAGMGHSASITASNQPSTANLPVLPALTNRRVFLPFVANRSVASSPFGVESGKLTTRTILRRGGDLNVRWLRVGKASWMAVQPNQGDPYNWAALQPLDNQLLAANLAGLTPMVDVLESPAWATINVPWPTSCGAIRSDRFVDFANFMDALVRRYSAPPFNVHNWELGNEPDVDPSLVGPNSIYGCWGDRNGPFYGGRHYGEMLKVVTPRIKAVDPTATVMNGGLLLFSPSTKDNNVGKPENFLAGIFAAGAAPYLDAIAYHSHSGYYGAPLDYSGAGSDWAPYGGGIRGKPRYLKQVMAKYGVSKPLFLNEGSLGCPPDQAPLACTRPGPGFLEAQANHLLRMMTMSLGEGVKRVVWFTLEGPGWRSSGLLNSLYQPQPSYVAYQVLVGQLHDAALPPAAMTAYTGVEGYRFTTREDLVDVLWSKDAKPDTIHVPASKFIAAYNRNGRPVPSVVSGTKVTLTVPYSGLYIHRRP